MILELILIINTYYFINLGEYILHYISHSPKYGSIIYKWHRDHHVIEFPPSKLTKDIYPNTIPRYQNIYLYFIILWWMMMYHILPFYYFKILFIESSIYFVIIDRLHTSYHLNDSIFERSKWFREKKRLQLLHHKKTLYNLNLLDFTSDKLLKSYKNENK